MYQDFFGLRERPFGLTSNLRYLLLTPKHQEALANLEYGLAIGDGITLLLAEAGTGKTTLLRKLLVDSARRPTAARVVCLSNPTLTAHEFFEFLTHEFALSAEAAGSKPVFLRELERTLVQQRQAGGISAVVVDEAQCLTEGLLEEVRLLANIETETEKPLRIILAGQPALGHRLNEPRFQQLKQRIGLRCVLPPLDLRETAIYIAHRITVGGGSPARTFSRDAVLTIYQRSRGIPRTINVICENALLTAYAAGQKPVEPDIVLEVCADFDLDSSPQAETTDAVSGASTVRSINNGRCAENAVARSRDEDDAPAAVLGSSFPYLRLKRR
jgi:general secretion pathway protein A